MSAIRTRYFFNTNADGWCEYSSKKAAIRNAELSAYCESVEVKTIRNGSIGRVVHVARATHPTHEQACMRPDIHGYED